MNKRLIYISLVLALCVIALSGCGKRSYFSKNTPKADVQIIRFDQALLNIPTDSMGIQEGVKQLWEEYPEFMPFFTEDIIGCYAEDTACLCSQLPNFLEDTLYGFKQTNQREQEIFKNTDDIKKQMDIAFGRIQSLYPDWYIPNVTLFVSGFNASIFWMDDDIAVGADMYLGSDYEYYNRVVYDYQKITMRKECIPTDVVSAYLFRNIPFTSDKNRLLENMIYRGKIMYLTNLVIPNEKEWETMGWSKEKWEWCNKYEKDIWYLIMDKKDLYKSEHTVLTSYLNDGPFTSEISQDAPPRIGTWIGWKIAESYMKHNPDVSLQQLMEEGDAQKILEESEYRP